MLTELWKGEQKWAGDRMGTWSWRGKFGSLGDADDVWQEEPVALGQCEHPV